MTFSFKNKFGYRFFNGWFTHIGHTNRKIDFVLYYMDLVELCRLPDRFTFCYQQRKILQEILLEKNMGKAYFYFETFLFKLNSIMKF